jgi:hypothetical protein
LTDFWRGNDRQRRCKAPIQAWAIFSFSFWGAFWDNETQSAEAFYPLELANLIDAVHLKPKADVAEHCSRMRL